ncbi:hAT family C-terminal dimerization domain containing protein [Nitzschia inconspicua]|uniref:HAT family C-terminal dimerization domain containing protein n=1 Tax=Nitzschia inconspicua TaxID=303405 RepID=A0A9K3PVI1_9STRA|nr:hAT family C-terminal dimerization domain containing protein [Nitzschia inconspicua]KAG7361213.1 hAT family C-terminal dimerization domain containing protein [Nitzschia inconspicua]
MSLFSNTSPRKSKAGVHKKKTLLSYQQCYQGVNAEIISDSMSFQLDGPHIKAFAQRNPDSTAFMERGNDHRIKRVFVCPPFANKSLEIVKLKSISMDTSMDETMSQPSYPSEINPIAFDEAANTTNGTHWLHPNAAAVLFKLEKTQHKCKNTSTIQESAPRIQATSAPTERVFSAASMLIEKRRNRLDPELAGKMLFVAQNWDLHEK